MRLALFSSIMIVLNMKMRAMLKVVVLIATFKCIDVKVVQECQLKSRAGKCKGCYAFYICTVYNILTTFYIYYISTDIHSQNE